MAEYEPRSMINTAEPQVMAKGKIHCDEIQDVRW